MAPIRILVVDDSVVVRRLVSDALSADPAIQVVGTAANGRIALAKIPQVNPDLVTMDVEMPDMDGLQTLTELRKAYPLLPVIMFSTLTQRGASATLDALTLGASDYVTKPSGAGSMAAAHEQIRDQLIPRIKQLCGRGSAPGDVAPTRTARAPAPLTWPATTGRPTLQGATLRPSWSGTVERPRVEVVAIGVSTGGPNALAVVVPALPADFPVPVLIVQHMPPLFTRLLAERLASKSALDVREGAAGDPLKAGCVHVAPGDQHMGVLRGPHSACVRLHQGPPENSCRPAVDVLFRSVAEIYGAGVLGVVLTGMGRDGLRGSESIREAGGQVIAQDEASSVVWGMPGYVARAGLADRVLPVNEIADEIVRRTCPVRGRTP